MTLGGLLGMVLDVLVVGAGCYGANLVFGWLVGWLTQEEAMQRRHRLWGKLLLILLFALFSYQTLKPVLGPVVQQARLLMFRFNPPTEAELHAAKVMAWQHYFKQSAECDAPKMLSRAEACRRTLMQAQQQFERRWQQRLDDGKLPEELTQVR